MISDKMQDALNQQIQMEGHASATYLAMASWCEQKNMDACAQFFYKQSDEERMHMLKLFHYVNEMDGVAISPGITKPETNYGKVQALFASFLSQEKKVTEAINNLVKMAQAETDLATYNFLQWYVQEQREEETLAKSILDKIELIGEGPQSLYFIDKEIESINARPAG